MVCTTIDQSKKLLELGIDVATADMWYPPTLVEYGIAKEWWDHATIVKDIEHSAFKKEYYIPAWSLTALLELIPESINDYTNNFSQLEMTKKSTSYVYADGRLRIGYLKSNLLDAAFEMVCWLLTNKLLTI